MRCATNTILAVVALLLQSLSTAADNDLGTVRGIVTDRLSGRVSDVSVEFRSNDKQDAVVTSPNGSYRINLRPGTYEVRARAKGFCPTHRAAISVLKGMQMRIDFQLIDCGIIDSTEPPPATAETRESVKPPGSLGNGYGEEKLDPLPGTGLCPLILFGSREEKGQTIIYSELQRRESRLPPLFTYNFMTLKATTLVLSVRDKTIEGIGHATWQDGKHTWHGARIKVSLAGQSARVISKEQVK